MHKHKLDRAQNQTLFRKYWNLPVRGKLASHRHPGNEKVPPPQSIWNVAIFGSLALGTLPRGLPFQAYRVRSSSWLTSEGPTGQNNLSGGDGSRGDCSSSSNIVGRGLPGVEPLHVTAMAEQVPVQREAAAALLVTQLHPAVLTVVALEVIISVHGYHPHDVLTALRGEDGLAAGRTLGSIIFVVVSHTVHLVGEVHCEGDAIQALVANDAPEAAWVIGLPHGLQDLLQNQVTADTAFLSCLLKP